MWFGRFPRSLVGLALVAPLTLGVVACGPSASEAAKHSKVASGPMPSGGEWQGVYYSPLYGYLHVVADGKAVNGAWRTAAGDAFGELHGETDGNLMRYEWKERRIGAVGADAVKKGKGYFVYSVPKEGEAHQIKGQWGLGEDDAGNQWEAVKQKNMPPDIKSVQPDEYEGRVTGGGWDSGSGDKDSGDKGDKGSGDTDMPDPN
ncbi:MAG TPA: hypothetical protein VGQ57_16665 [Polyangiaceae bacterium]|jgi:hypothetical protein|nr:hypothetical protein [Polyangiaceae bacterium]